MLDAWQVANLAPGTGGIVTVTGVISGQVGSVFTNAVTITTAYLDTNPANNTSTISVMIASHKLYLPVVARP